MHVPEEIGGDEDACCDDLAGDVPFAADYAEDHAEGEEEAEGEGHEEDMGPEAGVEGFGGDGFAFGDFGVAAVGGDEGGGCEEGEEGEEDGRRGA